MTENMVRDGLKTYDPIDLQRQLMEQEVVITRAIHALALSISLLRETHSRNEHNQTAAQLRSATKVAQEALVSISELVGCYELVSNLDLMSG